MASLKSPASQRSGEENSCESPLSPSTNSEKTVL